MVVGLAAVFVGVARRAYELSSAYVSERTSWGRPLREHQAVALVLADAATAHRRARLAVWKAAWALGATADDGRGARPRTSACCCRVARSTP
jgi:alkylation response protein AidB-like acyl-CoA dehydrogenase